MKVHVGFPYKDGTFVIVVMDGRFGKHSFHVFSLEEYKKKYGKAWTQDWLSVVVSKGHKQYYVRGKKIEYE